jgi:hypothetical protein
MDITMARNRRFPCASRDLGIRTTQAENGALGESWYCDFQRKKRSGLSPFFKKVQKR